MAPSDAEAWKRLGSLLVQRRAQIDPRYGRRTRFAEERHIGHRIVYEVEKARRQNFGEGTMAAIEAAYELAPGAIRRYLEQGGQLETAPPSPATTAERLGLQFMTRRAAIDLRYQDKRDAFADERGIDEELVRDIEFGRRTSFSPDEKAVIEHAYGLTRGSLARTLAAGQLEPASDAAAAGDDALDRVTVISAAASPDEREVRAQLARYPKNTPAELLFPDDEIEQMIWRQESKTEAQKILQIAALRTVSRPKVSRHAS